MASMKGRRGRWNNRTLRLFVIEKRYEKRQREMAQRQRKREKQEQLLIPQRQEIIRYVLDRAGDSREFGLAWEPTLPWARGNSIWPYAQIFDNIVGPDWKISAVDDICGSGSPGWFFERVKRAA